MRRDESYLLDMLTEARRATRFVENLAFQEFCESRVHQYATLRSIEIVGEAASRISDAKKSVFPQIPWHAIAEFRNQFVHADFSIDLRLIWRTVHDEVPALVTELERIVPYEDK